MLTLTTLPSINIVIKIHQYIYETYEYRPGSLPIDGNERELLEFVGQLLVYAARSDIALGLDLPLLFWRLFCGDEVELDDLRDVDVIAYTSLARLRSCANAVLTALAAPPDPPPLPPRPNQTPRFVLYLFIIFVKILHLIVRAAPSQLSAADAALREAVESLGSSVAILFSFLILF